MDAQKLISRFAVALGIGLLIGLERDWRTRGFERGRRAAGIRTFAVTGLLGGTTGVPASAAVAATALLALRQQIHGWVANITWPDCDPGWYCWR